MISGKPTNQAASLRRALTMLFIGDCFLCMVLFVILVLMFGRPYHTIKANAAAFDAATNCDSFALSENRSGPCSVEWANVIQRYFGSRPSGRSSAKTYYYYLRLRQRYGDETTVQLENTATWWRTTNGSAIKLQRWGDRITAVQLASGETSPTEQNPDWQLQNDVRGLRVLSIMTILTLVFAAGSGIALRVIPQA